MTALGNCWGHVTYHTLDLTYDYSCRCQNSYLYFTEDQAKPQKGLLSLCHCQDPLLPLLFIPSLTLLGFRYLPICTPAGNGTKGGCRVIYHGVTGTNVNSLQIGQRLLTKVIIPLSHLEEDH